MAFAYTVDTNPTVFGNRRFVTGTYTNGAADSGGAIVTGLSTLSAADLMPTSHVGVTDPKFTISTGTITVVVPNDTDGQWWAIGA